MTRHELNEELSSAVSALVDGELQATELQAALSGSSSAIDAHARDRWACYHLIGEALRHGELAEPLADAGFVARTMGRIATAELEQLDSGPLGAMLAVQHTHRAVDSANDSFGWKLVAGIASLAAVGAVAWAGLGLGGFGAGSAPAVFASAAGVAASPTNVEPGGNSEEGVLRNAELDRYLAAHSQAVGGAALQTTGSFVRNASFVSTDDGE